MGRPKNLQPSKLLSDVQIVELERMSGIGMSQVHMAMVLGMQDTTLQKRFKDQQGVLEAYERGRAAAANVVLTRLWDLIEQGHPASIFFYCKTRLGWRETNHVEVSGSLSIEDAIKAAAGAIGASNADETE